MNNQLPYWLAAIHMPSIGPRKFLHWLEYFSTPEKLFNATRDELEIAGISQQQITVIKQPDWKSVEKALAWALLSHQHLIAIDDAEYPALLKQISDPPLVLYVQGNKDALSQSQLAIVGARKATPYGLQNAEQFARNLIEVGFVITSGLAHGIDGAAHQGALLANGVTIGVTGTGLNHIYPRGHKTLVERMIAQNSAVISEFPLHASPHPMNFPRRNRIIAGLSLGVLVVECALKSGSLITARHAIEYDREVFAVPGSIHQALARGCHHLIRQGAKLVETVADILEELPQYEEVESRHARPTVAGKETNGQPLSYECQQVFEQIGYEITAIDVIILRSGLTVAEVSSILLTLELHGSIQSVAGGYIRVHELSKVNQR